MKCSSNPQEDRKKEKIFNEGQTESKNINGRFKPYCNNNYIKCKQDRKLKVERKQKRRENICHTNINQKIIKYYQY